MGFVFYFHVDEIKFLWNLQAKRMRLHMKFAGKAHALAQELFSQQFFPSNSFSFCQLFYDSVNICTV
jgi:hypothetical protein